MKRAGASSVDRLLAVVEVLVVYGAIVGLFMLLSRPTLSALQSQWFGRGAVVQYAASGLILVALLAISGPSLAAYGLALKDWRRDLLITARGFIPIFLLGIALSWINWEQWMGSVVISLLEVALLIWLVNLLHPAKGKRLGLAINACAILGWSTAEKSGGAGIFPALRNVLIVYLLVAPVEEVLFRGYIQSRLNRAFGRPYQTGGVRWGWGLVFTSLLFGVWHVVIPLRNPVWPHALWTFFAGLIFGYLRERSEGIVVPSLLHGVMNYGPQALIYELFF